MSFIVTELAAGFQQRQYLAHFLFPFFVGNSQWYPWDYCLLTPLSSLTAMKSSWRWQSQHLHGHACKACASGKANGKGLLLTTEKFCNKSDGLHNTAIYIYIYVIFYTCTNAYNSAVKWHWPLIHQTLFCFLTSESSRRSLFTDPAVSNCGVNWKNKNVKNAKIPSPMSPPSGSHSPVAGETTTNPCSGDQNPASP